MRTHSSRFFGQGMPLAAALLALPALSAGAGPDAAQATEAARATTQGLTLTFTRAGDGNARPSDSRKARLVALYVPHGTTPTPFLDPGPFVATWTGSINLR